MKYFILFATVCMALQANAQNVGVGQATPTEKLDVNGNVNITGAIKANGVAGTAGQVLMSSGTGLSWGSMLNYRKCVVFRFGSGNWTVPAGVTEVMVELWGAGSGGTPRCGGSSGGYARTVQTVTPGSTIAYVVGAGSVANYTSSNDGGYTRATFPGGYIQAYGGGGVGVGGANFPGYTSSGTTTLTNNAFFMDGNEGQGTTSTFGQKSSTIYTETRYYGAGGAAPGIFNPTPVQGQILYLENGTTVSDLIQRGGLPGSGGGSGQTGGVSGGYGFIIFWFNN